MTDSRSSEPFPANRAAAADVAGQPAPAQSAHDGAGEQFRAARDFLLQHREDYETAQRDFRWPRPEHFNWALDWFDAIAPRQDRTALWIVEADGDERKWTFGDLTRRSNQVANWMRGLGVERGDRLVLMLGNQVELWETILAAMKLGAVVIPATPLLGPDDLRDRIERGRARHVVTTAADAVKFADVAGDYTRIAVGEAPAGWVSYQDSESAAAEFAPDAATRADEPFLLYFTSGTTAQPKLVEHSHVSYPIGHLSTMYWIGLEPGDVHLNISSPGWAKHAWSNVFAPWNAEAAVFVYNYRRFDAQALLETMRRCGITSFCAPPTVWRMLLQADLEALPVPPRKVLGAGEPLNPEIIERVRGAWSVTIRDGFGQTETSVLVANTPGQPVRPGSMGRPLPGFAVELVDANTGEPAEEGEICVRLRERPVGLMTHYADDAERNAEVMRGGYYHTGDVGRRDDDGYITYVGRTDDVFKASDYRISPFELESVLLEHEAVAEAAVVPSPDPIRLAVPKAYVLLSGGHEPDRETARSILRFAREHLAAYKRVRRLEFAELPKTISGKIRRVQLRHREEQLDRAAGPEGEYGDADLAD